MSNQTNIASQSAATGSEQSPLIILTDSVSGYSEIVLRLRDQHGARVVELDPGHDGVKVLGSRDLLLRILKPSTIRHIRRACATTPGQGRPDVVVFGWYAIVFLALCRTHLIKRPRSVVTIGVFVHNVRLRKLAFYVLRLLGSRQWDGVAFSDSERIALIEAKVFNSDRCHHVVYRRLEDLGHDASSAPINTTDVPYLFTAGFSNRDYRTFSLAVSLAPWPTVVVASAKNRSDLDVHPPVAVEWDVPWDRYEALLREARAVVIPLLPGGDASGQSVLLTAMKYSVPVIATRHTALVDYLGLDYPGWAPASDPVALRTLLDRAMTDDDFVQNVRTALDASRDRLYDLGEMADEIARIALPQA